VFFFLPLGTTRPHWRTPWATFSLIGLCVLVFILQVALGQDMPSGFVPARASLGAWLLAMFMHADVFHLLGNMLFLWLFGTLAEDVLGPRLFLGFYFAGNAAATVLDWVMTAAAAPDGLAIPRVGASGAIAGIMGLSAVCFLRTRVRIGYLAGLFVYWRVGSFEVAAPVFLGLWGGWELLQGFLSASSGATAGVAHWAHVGGFLLGLAGAVGMSLDKRIAREDLLTGRHGADESVGRYAEVGDLEQLVRRSPQDAEVWSALGLACEGMGRLARAKEAYHAAVTLFLGQRRARDAARAYESLSSYQDARPIPAGLHFDLACGLEELEKFDKAYHMFRSVAADRPGTQEAETALIRAGEIAFTRLHSGPHAADCYRLLLEQYPHSPYRGLAQERLEQLPHARPPEPAQGQARYLGPRHRDLRPLGPLGGADAESPAEGDTPASEDVLQ